MKKRDPSQRRQGAEGMPEQKMGKSGGIAIEVLWLRPFIGAGCLARKDEADEFWISLD